MTMALLASCKGRYEFKFLISILLQFFLVKLSLTDLCNFLAIAKNISIYSNCLDL